MLFFKMTMIIQGVEHDAAVTAYYNPGTDHAINSSSDNPNDPEDYEIRTIEIDRKELIGKEFAQAEQEAKDHLERDWLKIKRENDIERAR